MANIAQRAGGVRIRIGGNTQETAVLVASTPDGRILEKNLTGVTNPVRNLEVIQYRSYRVPDTNTTPGNYSRVFVFDV